MKVLLIAILNCAPSLRRRLYYTRLVERRWGHPLIGVTIPRRLLGYRDQSGWILHDIGCRNSVLQVSYVGYVTQEIKVTEPTTLEIFPEQDN